VGGVVVVCVVSLGLGVGGVRWVRGGGWGGGGGGGGADHQGQPPSSGESVPPQSEICGRIFSHSLRARLAILARVKKIGDVVQGAVCA